MKETFYTVADLLVSQFSFSESAEADINRSNGFNW